MDAQAWDERYAGADLVWSAEPNRFVVAELSDEPPAAAYDMAAGEGRNAIWLARRGWTVTAADFSAVALDKGRRLLAGQPDAARLTVRWVRSDVLQNGPEAAAYDLVLLAYLQLPAAQRRIAVRAAAAALRPGGTLLVIAHDSTNLREGVGGPQDPALLYTAADVVADLADVAGLVVERAERVARPVPLDGVERTAWDALARLRNGSGAGRRR